MLCKSLSEKIFIATWVFILGSSVSAGASINEQPSADSEELTLCREAWLAWRTQLRSGAGDGMFENFADDKICVKANVKVSFTHNKYRVEMDFLKSQNRDTKQMAIYNNDNILFHVRYFPVNSKIEIKEGYCHDIKDADMPPVESGFPFSPCHPIMSVGSAVMESLHLTFNRIQNDGLLVLRYQNQGVYMELEASKRDGYNLNCIRTYRDGFDSPIAGREVITWDKLNGIWFVKTIERQQMFFEDGKPTGSSYLCRFSYSSFSVNPELDEKLFTIDSAGLPEGVRILDNRPQATVREYHYTRFREQNEGDEGILSAVHRLPSGRKSQSNRPLTVSPLYIVLITIGVVLVLLGGVIWTRKSKKT